MGWAGVGFEVGADGAEVVAFKAEKAAGEVEGVIPDVGLDVDAEAGGLGADHGEIKSDVVADEDGSVGEAGKLAEDFGRVAALLE